jgi:hypothetical protein
VIAGEDLAVAVGFEPTEAVTSRAFQICSCAAVTVRPRLWVFSDAQGASQPMADVYE